MGITFKAIKACIGKLWFGVVSAASKSLSVAKNVLVFSARAVLSRQGIVLMISGAMLSICLYLIAGIFGVMRDPVPPVRIEFITDAKEPIFYISIRPCRPLDEVEKEINAQERRMIASWVEPKYIDPVQSYGIRGFSASNVDAIIDVYMLMSSDTCTVKMSTLSQSVATIRNSLTTSDPNSREPSIYNLQLHRDTIRKEEILVYPEREVVADRHRVGAVLTAVKVSKNQISDTSDTLFDTRKKFPMRNARILRVVVDDAFRIQRGFSSRSSFLPIEMQLAIELDIVSVLRNVKSLPADSNQEVSVALDSALPKTFLEVSCFPNFSINDGVAGPEVMFQSQPGRLPLVVFQPDKAIVYPNNSPSDDGHDIPAGPFWEATSGTDSPGTHFSHKVTFRSQDYADKQNQTLLILSTAVGVLIAVFIDTLLMLVFHKR